MAKVITANTLAAGIVVFQASDGSWVHDIDKAATYEDAAAAEDALTAALRDVAAAIIVDPFVTNKGATVDGRAQMTLRDSIRAYGPTIRFLPGDPAAV